MSEAAQTESGHIGAVRGIDVRLSTIRWTLLLLSLVVAGPIAAGFVAQVRAPDGGPEASLFTGAAIMPGIVALVVTTALAAVLGVLSARYAGPRSGLRNAGFVLAWAAYATGEVDDIIRLAESSGPFGMIALEGAVVAAVGIALAAIILAAQRPTAEIEVRDFGQHDPKPWRSLLTPAGLAALAVALVVALVVAHAVAYEGLRGQAIFAAGVAGIAAGLLGRIAASFLDASNPPPTLALHAGVCLAAAIAPWSARVLAGSSDAVLAAAEAGTLPGASLILPLDWIAGALIGVQIGSAWAGGSIQQGEKVAS